MFWISIFFIPLLECTLVNCVPLSVTTVPGIPDIAHNSRILNIVASLVVVCVPFRERIHHDLVVNTSEGTSKIQVNVLPWLISLRPCLYCTSLQIALCFASFWASTTVGFKVVIDKRPVNIAVHHRLHTINAVVSWMELFDY